MPRSLHLGELLTWGLGKQAEGTTTGPSSCTHTPEGLAGSAARAPTPGFPWQDGHLARACLQHAAILSYKCSLTLSSETQIRRLQMVPLTDCSQEPCQMDLS